MIERILIVALFTIGYCCTFWHGMIFERIGNYLELQLPEWLWKPMGGCYVCACMWIGSLVYWVLYNKPYPGGGYTVDVKDWLITCVCAMGFNAIISLITTKHEPDTIVNDEDSDIEITISNEYK